MTVSVTEKKKKKKKKETIDPDANNIYVRVYIERIRLIKYMHYSDNMYVYKEIRDLCTV